VNGHRDVWRGAIHAFPADPVHADRAASGAAGVDSRKTTGRVGTVMPAIPPVGLISTTALGSIPPGNPLLITSTTVLHPFLP